MPELLENVISFQREVQRKFGRNLLRLQQVELLAKILVAGQSIATTMDGEHSETISLRKSVSRKSLGQVVGDLTSTLIGSDSDIPDWNNAEDSNDLSQPVMRMNSRIIFSVEDFNHTQQKLAALVDLRNELAHHFLEKYDIWTEPGCLAAEVYLDECFKQIDAHFEELQQWHKHRADVRTKMVDLLQSPDFEKLFIHGSGRGKAEVLCAASPIISLLQDAEKFLAKEGWTLLSRAIAYIGQREAEQTPKKYGCSSWRHVLHESKQFEVRKAQSAPSLPTEIWYRSRPYTATLAQPSELH